MDAMTKEFVDKLDEVKERLIVIETKMDAVRDMQNDMKDVRRIADKADVSAGRANDRLDRYDKNLYALWVAVIGIAVKAAYDLFGKGG